MQEIIKQLKLERDALENKLTKIKIAIGELEEIESPEIKPVRFDKKIVKIARGISERTRRSNSEIEEKKKKVEELLKEGKFTKLEIAKKADVHVSSIYLWFDVSKFPKKEADHKTIAKEAYKKKWGDKNPNMSKKEDPHQSKRKHLCSNCHENVWSAWWEGKQLCKRCFAIKKVGEKIVERREKEDPEIYDLSDMEIDKIFGKELSGDETE
jgi:hypothetical protein